MNDNMNQPEHSDNSDITSDLSPAPPFEEGLSMIELDYLIRSIKDYYSDGDFLDGDEWKKETSQFQSNIPKVVDKEVQKAFVSQLRKFQD